MSSQTPPYLILVELDNSTDCKVVHQSPDVYHSFLQRHLCHHELSL